MSHDFVPQFPARTPLAMAVGALFFCAAPTAWATQTVTNCLDDGSTGSLRKAIQNAAPFELVDASGLSCSTITLRTGALFITQSDLQIQGPGTSKLTITGKYNGTTEPYRLITHYGGGELTISNLSMSKGYMKAPSYAAARGGCILSLGSLYLENVSLGFCTAKSVTATHGAKGGALYVEKTLTINNSSIGLGEAYGYTTSAAGGAIYVRGELTVKNSTISGNSALGKTGTNIGFGGAIYSRGSSVYLSNTTVSGNYAGLSYGAISSHNLSGSLEINQSTISGNKANAGKIGGVYASNERVYLYNTTIAFNTAASTIPGGAGVGIAVYGGGSTPKALFSSTLISNNTYGASATSKDFTSSGVTVTGTNNLIRVPDGPVPGGTITGKCPFLGPLKNNGGMPQTHALLGGSPALDAGANVLNFNFDQRGSPYVRMSSPPGAATQKPDIGAFEVNRLDKIFDATFDSGCT